MDSEPTTNDAAGAGRPAPVPRSVQGTGKGSTAKPPTRPAATRAPATRPAETPPPAVRHAEPAAALADVQPPDAPPRAKDVRPAEVRPAEVRSAEVRPAEVRPPEARPAEVRQKPEARPAEVRPPEARPPEARHAVRPADPTVPTNIYRARRSGVAAVLIVPAVAVGMLLLRALAISAFGTPFRIGGVLSSSLGLAALPLLVAGLYGLITGAAYGAEQWGFKVWARPPLAYLVVGIAFAVAAGIAAP